VTLEPPSPPRRAGPYADAPRLPEGDKVDVRSLVVGAWIEVEIGPGRGGFLFERALAAPGAGLLGFEVRRKWAAIVDARLARAGLGQRARVFAGDAKEALARLVPDASVRSIYLHFPDPWWKRRHEKRLVLDPVLVDVVARLLEPDGELFVQTDVAERAERYEALLLADARFRPAGDFTGSARLTDNPYDARSPRERRALQDGLPVYRVRFRRCCA
jgi:tRNA (guanine-N7-)-methyltransferase